MSFSVSAATGGMQVEVAQPRTWWVGLALVGSLLLGVLVQSLL